MMFICPEKEKMLYDDFIECNHCILRDSCLVYKYEIDFKIKNG